MFDKKANVLAAVIVGTVLLAGGTLLLTQLGAKDEKVDAQQRITAEADTAMRQAIAIGIDEWMRNGFSSQNKVWYSQGALPPPFDEAKDSLHELVNKNVDIYMERLRKENKDYYISKDVEVTFDVTEPLDDDFEKILAKATEFKVGLETADSSQIEDISTTYDYPYKAWLIYTNMNEWLKTNADSLTQNLHAEAMLGDKGCQLVTGGCDCTALGFSNASKNAIMLTEDDVLPVIDASVATLNTYFDGSDIDCSYVIEMMSIENTEKIAWSQGDVGPNGTHRIEPREDGDHAYYYPMERWVDEERTKPRGDSCGGLPQGPDAVPPPGDDCTVRDLLENEFGPVDDGTLVSYDEWDPDDNEECLSLPEFQGGEQDLGQSMKVGMLAMDKKLAALITVKCEDPDTSIETAQGLEPMTGEIRMRVNLALDCPLPNKNPDLYDNDPVSCPGGSCFPAGTMITMADGTKKPIELVVVGDVVMSYNTYANEKATGVVMELESPVREGLYLIEFDDESNIEVTNEHPFYTRKADGELGWASIIPEETYKETKTIDNVMELEVGDAIMRQDGVFAEIISITYNEGTVQTYNLKEVSTYDNFFADEKLAHNKCCFAAGTPVTMADGTTKPIEEVSVGDFVLTYNEATGALEPAEVYELQQPVREGLYVVTFANGKVLEVTNDHPLMTRDGWAAIEVEAALAGYALSNIDELVVGSEVLQQDLTYSAVESIVYKEGDVQTYTLKKVAKNKNFFANGFLAHNQKLIGYVGLACPFPCDPCYGCAPAEGAPMPPDPNNPDHWQCVGPLPNLICGKCGLCDEAGECTIPQYAGYPCFDENGNNMMDPDGSGENDQYNDCWACDGINTGDEGCVMNPPEITSLITVPCDGPEPCSMCDGSGNSPDGTPSGCAAAMTSESNCNDDSITEAERLCMYCPIGSTGECVEDTRREGETCDNCKTCESGLCVGPDPESEGNCQTAENPCMKCADDAAGVCMVDMSKNADCPACQKCAGDGSCEADNEQDGDPCGTCQVCSNGQCIAGFEGEQCRSSNGCTWTCQSGSCTIANEGSSCTLSGNTCGLNQRCTQSGCETQASDNQMFCCGDAKCAQGSPCCTYLNECSVCPSTG